MLTFHSKIENNNFNKFKIIVSKMMTIRFKINLIKKESTRQKQVEVNRRKKNRNKSCRMVDRNWMNHKGELWL